ncbi:serine hydrolase domain-containing protein [Bacillus toyonensis]|uniref:serine hydrolase domain-containing protein n=1 Tax=Bacillus toyonensis TaxID=155322 RepID=UPI000BFCFD31|nr:serine hydrolase domain-containing protein [Bacillus toyonensis]MED3540096.1 serine hydrolase [Bacillus toyonensis]MEE2016591.1 serine hydrolase [Bacillus toyonensis]PHG63327.1 serine hydrolase [Bacillus toyonensis]
MIKFVKQEKLICSTCGNEIREKQVMRKRQFAIVKIFVIAILILMISVSGVVFANDNESTNGDISKIDKFMTNEIERLNIPGASLAIVKGDQVEYIQGYGVSNPDGTKMTSQTPIVLGSTTKSFTALAIMQLVEQGKIFLEEPVQSYIPWFQITDEEASEKITIQHLLNHTSGFSTNDGQVSISQGNKTLKEHIKSLANTELTYSVGGQYQYSNLNYNILGLVIEAVTNKSYKEYINEFIFKPLEMNNSYVNPKDDTNNTIATGYQTVFGLKVPTKQLIHEGTVSSGYLISSAEDMANYMIVQLNQGEFKGKSILSANAMTTMHHPSALMGNDTYYAMGWEVNNEGISHNGWTENTYSKVVLDGEYGISLQINSMDYLNLNEYDAIISGIKKLVHNDEPSISDSNPFMKYVIIDLILLAIVALIVWSAYRIFKPKNRKVTTFHRILYGLSILVFNWLLPLIILIGFPKLFGPLSTVTLFAPGIGHLLFLIPLLFIIVGVVKLGKVTLTLKKNTFDA